MSVNYCTRWAFAQMKYILFPNPVYAIIPEPAEYQPHTHIHKPNHACIIMSGDEREEKWGEVRKGMEGRYSSLMCKLQEVGRIESDTTTQWPPLFPIVPPRW